MRFDPPLGEAARFPATAAVGIAAIAVSVAWWSGMSVDALVPGQGTIVRQPWRLLTSVLPHINLIHLVFNLLWWWRFGAWIERAWGGVRLLGLSALLALASGAAQYAFAGVGVGLSGVVYGLCTLLHVAQRRDARLVGAVDGKTLQLFAAWFVVCIVLTVAKVMSIGNVAHGVGAVVGWLIGECVVASGSARRVRIAALVAVLGLIAGATVMGGTGFTMFVPAEAKLAAGYRANVEGRFKDAEGLLTEGLKKYPRNAAAWENLAHAQHELGKHDEALASCLKVIELEPSGSDRMREYVVRSWVEQARLASTEGRAADAERLSNRVLQFRPETAEGWEASGMALQLLQQSDEALGAYLKAVEIDDARRERLKPAIVSILQNRAAAAFKQKDYVASRKAVEEALRWSPGDDYSVKMLMSLGSRGKGGDAPAAPSAPGGP